MTIEQALIWFEIHSKNFLYFPFLMKKNTDAKNNAMKTNVIQGSGFPKCPRNVPIHLSADIK